MSKSIWPKLPSKLVARALKAHSAIGVGVAAILYIVCLSGIISVLNHEFQRWEQPSAPEMEIFSPAAAQRAAESIISTEPRETHHFYIRLPTSDFPRAVVTTDNRAVFIDETGEIAQSEAFPWTQFILDLHYYLNLPATIGLTIVGLAGVILLAMSVTGFLAHPRIFRDAFRIRFSQNVRLTNADLHNRLSVWTSPFHISIALTGAMLGLTLLTAIVLGQAEHEGDTEAIFAPVFGAEPEANPAPADLPDIAASLTHMETEYGELEPNYVILHDPGTVGQHLQILAVHPNRLLFGDYYNFDSQGRFLGNVGMSDGSFGQQVSASAYRLHFGSFGGIPIKVAYVLLGAVLVYVVCTGMDIYFLRLRERGYQAGRYEAVWASIIWGTSFGLAFTLLLAASGTVSGSLLAAAFWISILLAALFGGLFVPAKIVRRIGKISTGASLIGALTFYLLHNGFDLGAPNSTGLSAAILVLAFGLVLWGFPFDFLQGQKARQRFGHTTDESAE